MLQVYLHYSSDNHLILLSFPTRRSSDLAAPLAIAVMASRCSTLARSSAMRPTDQFPLPIADERASIEQREDRKSTRLNSSHVSISYAVFCLKKKKLNILTLLLYITGIHF